MSEDAASAREALTTSDDESALLAARAELKGLEKRQAESLAALALAEAKTGEAATAVKEQELRAAGREAEKATLMERMVQRDGELERSQHDAASLQESLSAVRGELQEQCDALGMVYWDTAGTFSKFRMP